MRNVEMIVTPARVGEERKQFTGVRAELHRGEPTSCPGDAVWLIPIVVDGSDAEYPRGSLPPSVQAVDSTVTQSVLGAVGECFPTSAAIALRPPSDDDSDDSDNRASGDSSGAPGKQRCAGCGGGEPPEKRARTTPSTTATTAPATTREWTWVPLQALDQPVPLSEDAPPCLHPTVQRDLRRQYRPRREGSAPVPHVGFVVTRARLSLDAADQGSVASLSSDPSSAAESSRLLAALGDLGRPLARLCGGFLHALPPTRAMFVPSRGPPPEEEAGTVSWHLTLISAGTVRRSDWFGGGKTPSEMIRDMRNRFASGSLRRLVPPKRSWSGSAQEAAARLPASGQEPPEDSHGKDRTCGRDFVCEELGKVMARSPIDVPDTVRSRKVIAGPNRDMFLMLAQ